MKNRLKKAVGVYFAKVTEHNQPGRVSFFLTGGYTTGHIESEASVMRSWLLDGMLLRLESGCDLDVHKKKIGEFLPNYS